MGNIEKYGVVALIFVIVMVLAVSIWGPRSTDMARQSQDSKTSTETATVPTKDTGTVASNDQATAKPLNLNGEDNSVKPLETSSPTMSNSNTATNSSSTNTGKTGGEYVKYRIRSGDNLESIAAKELGSKNKWNEIVKINEGLNPSRLKVGQEILIPTSGASSTTALSSVSEHAPATKDKEISDASSSSKRTYKVVKGDTLYDLATKFYKNGGKWKKIYDANKDKLHNSESLSEGVELTIP